MENRTEHAYASKTSG